MGLPIFESNDLWNLIREGQEIEVDTDTGRIIIMGGAGEPLTVAPIPPFMQELIRDGGLMKHIAAKKKSS